MPLTIIMLNHTSLVKVKAAISYLRPAVIQILTLMNSARPLKEDVHSKDVEVELAQVTQDQQDADTKLQTKTLTVKTPMLLNSLLCPNFKPSVDQQAANASTAILLIKEIMQLLPVTALNMIAEDQESTQS